MPSEVLQRNYYGKLKLDADSVSGNFATLNAKDSDDSREHIWKASDTKYYKSTEDSQEYIVFHLLHKELHPEGNMTMEIKDNVVYEVLSGWKLWELETSTTIAAQEDGHSFEIGYPVPDGGVATLAAAAASLVALFAFWILQKINLL